MALSTYSRLMPDRMQQKNMEIFHEKAVTLHMPYAYPYSAECCSLVFTKAWHIVISHNCYNEYYFIALKTANHAEANT